MSKYVNASDISIGNAQEHHETRTIGCDQVAWIGDALDRFAAILREPRVRVSRMSEAARLACLLEIMEVIGVEFENDTARSNAIASFRELRSVRTAVCGEEFTESGLYRNCHLQVGHKGKHAH